jgi:hypothetical protein
MRIVVNVTDRNTTVYIDSGTYNISSYSYGNILSSLLFSLIGDVSSSSSSVDADDISTYPLFFLITSQYLVPVFYLRYEGNYSFQYIKFCFGNLAGITNYFIDGFILFCFVLSCLIARSPFLDTISINIRNCMFFRVEKRNGYSIGSFISCAFGYLNIENSF